MNLTLMTELCGQDRHEVAIARSGVQSLEILSAHDLGNMFLDVGMRDMDGATPLQIYRFGKLNAAPAFFLTMGANAETPAKLRDTGAVGLLHKPVTSKQELRHAIVEVCESGLAIVLTPVPTQTPAKTAPPALKVVAPQFIDPWVIEGLKSLTANPEFLPELLVVAAEDIGRISDELVQALASSDIERIRDGVSASVGAIRLMALASKLMRATREQQEAAMKHMRANLAKGLPCQHISSARHRRRAGQSPLTGARGAEGMGRARQEKQKNGWSEIAAEGAFTFVR